MRTTSQAASEAAAHDIEAQPCSVGLSKPGILSCGDEKYSFGKAGCPSVGFDDNAAGALCHVHVTAAAATSQRPVFDVSAYTTGAYSALGGGMPAPAPPPAAIFTAAKNKLLDGGGSGPWSPLSPNGTGASAQLAQLLGLFDDGPRPAGGLGRSGTGSSDYILREFAAAGGFRDLDGDSSLDELGDIGDPHHHQPRGGVPSLLPISTDVSGGSSPTRFGGDDSPHPHEAFQPDFGPGPLHASVNGGGGFGSPFTGGLQRDSRAFGAGFLSFSGLAGPMGPQLSGLQTLSAPLHSLPQARPLRVNPHQMGMVPVEHQPSSDFLSHPVHLRDAGRAFSMPMPVTGAGAVGERHGASLPPWQAPTALEDPSRRRAKRQMDSLGIVKRKGSAPDLGMAAMALSEAVPKPKTAPKRGPGDKPRKPRRMRCQYCKTHQTPQWRCGPNGPRTLCNACGVRWNKGKLEVNGRPMPLSPITSSGSDITP